MQTSLVLHFEDRKARIRQTRERRAEDLPYPKIIDDSEINGLGRGSGWGPKYALSRHDSLEDDFGACG